MNQAIITMNGGEISPQIYNRVDLTKRSSSLAVCKNFIPQAYGGVIKRPGTQYIYHEATEFYDEDITAVPGDILFPFRGSDGNRFILHFSPEEMIATNIETNSSTTVALSWDITHEQISTVRFSVQNDIIILTSPHFNPVRLTYGGGTSWTFAALPYRSLPRLDDDTTGVTLRLTSTASPTLWLSGASQTAGQVRMHNSVEYVCTVNHTTGSTNEPGIGKSWRSFWKIADYAVDASVVLTASNSSAFAGEGGTTNAIWNTRGFFYLKRKRLADELQLEMRAITANNGLFTNPIVIKGGYDLQTFGTWTGTFLVQRSTDGSTWATIAQYDSNADRNISAAFTEDDSTFIRLGFISEAGTATSGQQRAVISPRSNEIEIAVQLTSSISATQWNARCASIANSAITSSWYRSAFAATVYGFPAVSAFFDNRLWLGGTLANPTTLWASQTGDFYNFAEGTNDTDAIRQTLTPTSLSPIRWLAAGRRLFIGLEYSEMVIGSEEGETVVTPSSFLAREYSFLGSHSLAPILANDALFFVQRHGKRIYEMAYSADSQSYPASDLTRLAEHFFSTDAKIISWAWQASREPTLWCVLSNGKLLSLSYNRQENYFAWAQHETVGGHYVAVSVVPTNAEDDHVFFLVHRGVNIMLESIPPNTIATNAAGTTALFFDCQQNFTFADSQFFPDTVPQDEFTVYRKFDGSENQFSLSLYMPGDNVPESGNYIGGRLVTSSITTLPLEAETSTGSSLGRKKRVHKTRVAVKDTLQLQAQSLPGTLEQLQIDGDTLSQWGGVVQTTDYYTGWLAQNTNLSSLVPCLSFTHAAGCPCHILTIVSEFEIYQS